MSLNRSPVGIHAFFSLIDVLIPGCARSPALLAETRVVLDFVREMDARQNLVAAICRRSLLPAAAGIVKGRQATRAFAWVSKTQI